MVSTLLLGAALVATPASAQIQEDKWTFQAILYGYFPDLGGSTKFPERTGGSSINVDIDQILSLSSKPTSSARRTATRRASPT